ncbi:sigma-54 dependent transcriptional regulator [Geminicoccaceae bacterium 1502E]|nr:sigma-54 dependent transcriptional regulator [Geminicoccaceae bacterium 1502E]
MATALTAAHPPGRLAGEAVAPPPLPRLLLLGAEGLGVAEALAAAGCPAHLQECRTIEAMLRILREGGVDLLLAELGPAFAPALEALRRERLLLPVLACGRDAQPRAAAEAIRRGAADFLPIPAAPLLLRALLEGLVPRHGELVAADPAMAEVLQLARRFAASQASIFITGESGTGKEMLARFIHRHSSRPDGPFVAVNCAAIPGHLLESELFGHEKGAFTGAVARRIGRFEEAHGGTLLLDEITEMEPHLQAKLLRAVQERTIERLGGGTVRLDVRLLATSNRDLEQAVGEQRFRADLYYRLNVLALNLPPLRERPQDVLALARHFAGRHSLRNGLPPRRLAPAAERRLMQHDWPGNVRELDNCVHRAVLLAEGETIGEEAILAGPARPQAAAAAEPTVRPGRTVAEVERELIQATLRHTLGNRTHAASLLGISIRTLRNKLRDYREAAPHGQA